jgi:hypothetical protein
MLVSFSRQRLCKLQDSINGPSTTFYRSTCGRLGDENRAECRELAAGRLRIPEIPPLTACYFEIKTADR